MARQWRRRASSNFEVSSNLGPDLKIKGGLGLSEKIVLYVALHCRKDEKSGQRKTLKITEVSKGLKKKNMRFRRLFNPTNWILKMV